MASRNRTVIFRKYRDALKSVRIPSSYAAATSSSTSSSGGPVIELVNASLLNPNRSYAPLSTEDPGNSRSLSLSLSRARARAAPVWLLRNCRQSNEIRVLI
jgi:syntaxin 16